MKKKLVIIGANGQVGTEIKSLEKKYANDFDFVFLTKQNLDIKNIEAISDVLKQKFDYCINCSAYTKVDKAEEDKEENFLINTTAVGNLSSICNKFKTGLIHISTDYVFDGKAKQAYKESDACNPLNEYGRAKFEGEKLCLLNNAKSIVFRTSWVYSSFGNNFVKTMLKLMPEKTDMNIVADQLGSPTYARDIAQMILDIIKNNEIENAWGQIFNFTNDGIISWFEFANAIKKIKQFKTNLSPILSENYKTLAIRPAYSGLNKDKFIEQFSTPLKSWELSLNDCLKLL